MVGPVENHCYFCPIENHCCFFLKCYFRPRRYLNHETCENRILANCKCFCIQLVLYGQKQFLTVAALINASYSFLFLVNLSEISNADMISISLINIA